MAAESHIESHRPSGVISFMAGEISVWVDGNPQGPLVEANLIFVCVYCMYWQYDIIYITILHIYIYICHMYMPMIVGVVSPFNII